MSRFSFEETFLTLRTADECLSAVQRTLRGLGGDVKSASPREVVAQFGSGLKTRLLGGMWISSDNLPVLARVTIRDQGARCMVVVLAEENLGFGSLMGMEAKYRRRCQEVAVEVVDGCQRQLT